MNALSEELLLLLNSRENKDHWLERKSGGIHLWGTLGFDIVIFPDGRMLSYEWEDGDDRKGKFSEIEDRATQLTAIRVASREIPELKEIMPKFEGKPCADCTSLVDLNGLFVVCETCGGTGMTS